MAVSLSLTERFSLLAEAGKRLRGAIAANDFEAAREEARYAKALLTQIEHEADRQAGLASRRGAGTERARNIPKGEAADAPRQPTPAIATEDVRKTDQLTLVDSIAAGADEVSAAYYTP
jgi:hypothetical protein